MRREIDVENLSRIGIYYGEEVERMGIKILVLSETSVHKASVYTGAGQSWFFHLDP
jgi:hypothetical protein